MKPKPRTDYHHYIPADFPADLGLTNGENALSVTVGYKKGGTNMFSGNDEPRGYEVSLHAVKRENGSTSFLIGGGFGRRFFLAPAPRFDAKKLDAVNAAILPRLPELVALMLASDYPAVRAMLTEIAGPVFPSKPSPRTDDETAHIRAALA